MANSIALSRRFRMLRFVLASLFLALSVTSALALPGAGTAQPDCLHFGNIYTGAIVEGSFQVFEPGQNADIPFAVTAPKFIKVQSKTTDARQFGAGNNFICGSVEFVFDTSAVGDLSGDINVTLGNAVVKVPISASVKPTKKGLTRLLIVETPFQRYSTKNGEVFKGWTDLVKASSLDVSYLDVTRGKPVLRDLDLNKFDCVLLASTGLVDLQDADVKRVREFAEAGGRVVVSADHFFRGTVDKANAVLDGYGIRMRDKESIGKLKDVTLEGNSIEPTLVKLGVKSAHFFRASPITVTDDQSGRILVNAIGVGVPGDGFVALTKAGKGKVIVIGQSLWWNWISEKQAAGTDNALLLQLLLDPSKEKEF
jgi:hypothetical protein